MLRVNKEDLIPLVLVSSPFCFPPCANLPTCSSFSIPQSPPTRPMSTWISLWSTRVFKFIYSPTNTSLVSDTSGLLQSATSIWTPGSLSISFVGFFPWSWSLIDKNILFCMLSSTINHSFSHAYSLNCHYWTPVIHWRVIRVIEYSPRFSCYHILLTRDNK